MGNLMGYKWAVNEFVLVQALSQSIVCQETDRSNSEKNETHC